MDNSIATILISVGGSLAVGIVGSLLMRKKTKAETEGIISRQYNELVTTLNEDRKELHEQIKANREVIKQQQRDNEECEYRHEVSELEMDLVKKKIGFQSLPKETVFILDDNLMVINEFKYRFSKVSAIEYRVFTQAENFLKEAQREQPEIIILDYLLDQNKTADEVIDELGYEPKIIIMSADKSMQPRFLAKGIQFFYKDEHYVYRIAKAVIQHLHDKN